MSGQLRPVMHRSSRRCAGSGRRARTARRAGVLTVSFVLVGGLGSPASAVDRLDTDRASTVLAGEMDAVGVPGAALAVVDRTGDEVVTGLGETGDGRSVTADTPFVIGSTSKSVTALAVMQLVDDGLVDLDAPIRRYVPDLRLADPRAADSITVRQVLQQTSGLPETAGGPVLKSARDGTALDAVRELAETRLSDPPGTVWHYSNANYVLAGLVVERASGTSYAEYVRRRIFAPLGMTSSAAHLSGDTGDGGHPAVSSGHRLWFGATIVHGPTRRSGLLPAGYLVSTATDMGRYLRMYLRDGVSDDGSRIVSSDALRTMTSPGPVAHLGGWADGAPARYAMGWFVGGPWQEPVLFHPGNTPDSSAMIAVVPGRGTAVATLMNLSHEIPVPGNPAATDRMSRDVVGTMLGERVDARPSTTRFYLAFDLIVLLLVGSAGWGLWRAARSLRRAPRHVLPAWLGVVARGVVIALLLATPGSIGYGWRGIWVWAPDLAVTMATLVGVLASTSVLRLLVLLRVSRPVPRVAGEDARSASATGTTPAAPAGGSGARGAARRDEQAEVMLDTSVNLTPGGRS